MTEAKAKGPIKRAQIEAVVIRADGTREDLGRVADSARRWNYGPGRLISWWKIRRLNRRHDG